MKTHLLSCLAGVAALTMPVAAHAGASDGKVQVKLMMSGVLPDGKIDAVRTDLIGVPAGTQTKANDNWVPTAAIEYFVSPNISIETICCLTAHHVDGAGAIGAISNLVDNVLILPATVTLKAHATGLGALKPYVGVGPSYFLILDSKVGAGGKTLGAASAKVNSKLGFALQAGVDVALNDRGLGLSLDAKRYFVRPVASFYTAAGVEALSTRHKLDPWVVSAGLAYRF
ncbi:MAG TPA: OmpW family outer membrane protein [Sphingobium sp.]|nr:OmpW family outer membrane protein [Sphingobium sp.]